MNHILVFLLLTLTIIHVQVNHIFYDDTLQMTRLMYVQYVSVSDDASQDSS